MIFKYLTYIIPKKLWETFKNWTQKKYWVGVGWLKSLEITRGKDNEVHPHFHVLILVKSSYFGRDYVTQKNWTKMWQKHMKLDYEPIIHISSIDAERVEKVIPEVAKYQSKPQELIDEEGAWLLGLTWEMKHHRTMNVGGVLRNYFKAADEETDLIGESKDKMVESPIKSDWIWDEEEGYRKCYTFDGKEIDTEEAIENFIQWTGA